MAPFSVVGRGGCASQDDGSRPRAPTQPLEAPFAPQLPLPPAAEEPGPPCTPRRSWAATSAALATPPCGAPTAVRARRGECERSRRSVRPAKDCTKPTACLPPPRALRSPSRRRESGQRPLHVAEPPSPSLPRGRRVCNKCRCRQRREKNRKNAAAREQAQAREGTPPAAARTQSEMTATPAATAAQAPAMTGLLAASYDAQHVPGSGRAEAAAAAVRPPALEAVARPAWARPVDPVPQAAPAASPGDQATRIQPQASVQALSETMMHVAP